MKTKVLKSDKVDELIYVHFDSDFDKNKSEYITDDYGKYVCESDIKDNSYQISEENLNQDN